MIYHWLHVNRRLYSWIGGTENGQLCARFIEMGENNEYGTWIVLGAQNGNTHINPYHLVPKSTCTHILYRYTKYIESGIARTD